MSNGQGPPEREPTAVRVLREANQLVQALEHRAEELADHLTAIPELEADATQFLDHIQLIRDHLDRLRSGLNGSS